MLRNRCRIIVQTEWDGAPADLMIALHARRSAPSVARWRESAAAAPLAVMLTGTDLYRDLPESREAAASLDAADRIVVLQEDALRLLAAPWRAKAEVIFQSAPPLARRRRPEGRLRCVAVGHLREEKDPATLFAAVPLIPRDLAISVRHIGAPLDGGLAAAAAALARADPRYRYSGPLHHGLTRAAIASAHLLVHPSIMEGGANVIVEAVMSHTPVIASRVSGNVGMLGEDYPGYFAARDASDLAARLVQALEPPFHRALAQACERRRALFEPAAEARAVNRLVAEMSS